MMGTSTVLSGLRLRPFAGESDLADIVRIRNAEAAADEFPEHRTIESMRAELSNPSDSFDARRDLTVAEVDGRAVALAWRQWIDTTDGVREYRLDGAVDPEWRRRGIGTLLHEDGTRRTLEFAAGQDTTLPRVFGSWSTEHQAGDEALLRASGFQPVRWFFDMTRPNLDDITEVPMPDGLELRPITPELARQVWLADVDAFQDHWGGFDHSDEHLERWLADPSTDLSLWVVAFDGDEVAGGILNAIDAGENEAFGYLRGWLASVFTRRAWRKRGLATALIARSLALLRERGMTSAALGVDGDNPSGAFGLYERVGFEVGMRSTAWRKPFQP